MASSKVEKSLVECWDKCSPLGLTSEGFKKIFNCLSERIVLRLGGKQESSLQFYLSCIQLEPTLALSSGYWTTWF